MVMVLFLEREIAEQVRVDLRRLYMVIVEFLEREIVEQVGVDL